MEDFNDIRMQLGRLDQSITSLEARRAQLATDVEELERRRLELDQLQSERSEIEQEVTKLADRKEALAGTLAALEQRGAQLAETSKRLEEQVRELGRRRSELEEAVAPLESQREELRTLERRRGKLQAEAASLNKELGERRAESERLDHEVTDARRRLSIFSEEKGRLEREMEELQDQIQQKLIVRGFGPETFALLQRLDESATRLGVTRDDMRVKIYALLDRLEMDGSVESELNAKRRELDRINAELAARRTDLANAQQSGQAVHVGAIQGQVDETTREIKVFGEQAAKAIESLVQEVRKETDYLFQEAMEIGARAAQVDADLRTREWFNQSVRYARPHRPRQDLRYVAERALESFEDWLNSRQLPAPRSEPMPPIRPTRQRRPAAAVEPPKEPAVEPRSLRQEPEPAQAETEHEE